MPGDACTRPTSDPASRSTVEMAARMAPCSRSRRVSRRVSMPSMPGTPAAASEACKVVSDLHEDARRAASRTTKPATCTPVDSGSVAFMP